MKAGNLFCSFTGIFSYSLYHVHIHKLNYIIKLSKSSKHIIKLWGKNGETIQDKGNTIIPTETAVK